MAKIGSIWKALYWGDNATVTRTTQADGTASEGVAIENSATGAQVLSSAAGGTERGLAVRVVSSPASGGGGAATVADGADVAQGTTTDLSSASTVVGILKAIKAAVTGTLSTSAAVSNFPASQAVTGTFWQGTQPVSLASAPTTAVTGTFWQTTQPVSLASAPTTAVTGTFWQSTQPVSLATNTPDVTDRAARLLGHVTVDNAALTTNATLAAETTKVIGTVNVSAAQTITANAGTNLNTSALALAASQSTLKAASTVAAAADTASVVQHSPQRADAANLAVTATAATGSAITLTLPAPATGLFHYISLISFRLTATTARTGTAPILVTSTNLPGSPVWDFDTSQAVGTTIKEDIVPATPIKSSVAATATTIVAPVATTGLWRLTAHYYTAP